MLLLAEVSWRLLAGWLVLSIILFPIVLFLVEDWRKNR